MARPASGLREAQHPEEGALLMLLPRGGRADNGWWMGDELCHQTRGLKDGPLKRYQSCLDQDVRLSRSSVLALLLPSPPLPAPSWALLPPSAFIPLFPPSSPLYAFCLFSSLVSPLLACSVASSVFLFFLSSHPSFLLPPQPLLPSSVFCNSGPLLLVTPPLTCYVGKILYFRPNYFSDALILSFHVLLSYLSSAPQKALKRSWK